MSKSNSILVIEDEIVLQDVYKLILNNAGYETHTASNGVDGLQQIKAIRPDLVLLDIFMPIMDGKELLRNIDLDDYPKMKIVVYSNLADKNTENEMIGLGAHDFVLKSSMTPNDLLELVYRHLR